MAPMGEPFDPSLVIFAALAVFIIWKLRSVLGVRVDRDAPPSQFQPRRPSPAGPAPPPGAAPLDDASGAKRTVAAKWDGVVEKGGAAAAGLDAIAAADPRFNGKDFLDGARRAYEIIVSAFARGDRDVLRSLLSKEVFDGFVGEIDRREEKGETLDTAVVAIDSALVDSARAAPRLNEATVRFMTRLMSVRRNKAGETIDGGNTVPVVELWTFARDPRASDLNWKLVATRPAE